MPNVTKVRVTRKGANETVDGASRRIPVGTVLTFDDGKIPAFLRGKCEVIGAAGEAAEMEVGEEQDLEQDLEQLQNEYELLSGNSPGNMKAATLVKKIAELKAPQE